MAAIFQTFSNAFSWMKMYEFWLRFHWSLFRINNIPLVLIMAWCRSGNKPLSGPLMVSLLIHTCVTQPQWVKSIKHEAKPQINLMFIIWCYFFLHIYITWSIVLFIQFNLEFDILFSLPGAETRIFQKNYTNTMSTDALTPHVTRSSAAMVLTM